MKRMIVYIEKESLKKKKGNDGDKGKTRGTEIEKFATETSHRHLVVKSQTACERWSGEEDCGTILKVTITGTNLPRRGASAHAERVC